MANEPDNEDASKPKRRPITIDLPAEEVGRKAASAEAAASSSASAQGGDAVGAEPSGATDEVKVAEASAKPAADDSTGAKAEPKAGPTGPEIPSAFATRKTASSSSPPKWRPIDDPPPPPQRTFGPILMAGIAGAAIAAIVVVGLFVSGLLPPRPDDGVAAEVAALTAELASLKQAAPNDDLTSLQQQVTALEQKVAESASAPPSGATDAQLKDFQDRLTALEQTGDQTASTDELEAQVSKLAQDLAALRNATPADAASLESSLTPIREELDQLSTRVEELAARVDATPAEDRIAGIEAKLDETTKKVDLAAALAPAVIADALDAAIDSGRPFSAELAALKSLAIGGDSVEQLATDAEAGVATLAELRSGFETAIAATDLTPTAPETTGTIDRLWQSAQGLVDVRPAHPTEGTNPSAIITRIHGALDAGDLKRAIEEWNTLPDSIKTPTADWARQVEARIKADDLVASVRSEALLKLGAGQ